MERKLNKNLLKSPIPIDTPISPFDNPKSVYLSRAGGIYLCPKPYQNSFNEESKKSSSCELVSKIDRHASKRRKLAPVGGYEISAKLLSAIKGKLSQWHTIFTREAQKRPYSYRVQYGSSI